VTPDDIRDIRPPIAIPYWWIPLAIGAAVVVGLALAYGLYRLVRRLRRERVKTAAEIALARIERARGLLSTLTSSEFSAELSAAVRAYIEARFSLRAAHRTTEEFLRELLDAGGSSGARIIAHRDLLEDFLGWCDLAKFAKLALTESRADAITLAARRFVETTAEIRDENAASPAPSQPTSPLPPSALEVPS
jgi:hypothetical protein